MENERNGVTYLIPANTKKSQLILGFFTGVDLAIFIIGCIWTFAMILIIQNITLPILIIILMPALVSAFLIMPVPHYHNILQLLKNCRSSLSYNNDSLSFCSTFHTLKTFHM